MIRRETRDEGVYASVSVEWEIDRIDLRSSMSRSRMRLVESYYEYPTSSIILGTALNMTVNDIIRWKTTK